MGPVMELGVQCGGMIGRDRVRFYIRFQVQLYHFVYSFDGIVYSNFLLRL